jgi:hypothetical protein
MMAPEHLNVPIGKQWSIDLITGGLGLHTKRVTVLPAQQNFVSEAKGIDPDYSGLGFILRWKLEF